MSLLKRIFSKITSPQEAWGHFLIGLSPVGILIPYIFISLLGICKGALGSGIDCYVPFFEVYPGTVILLMEVASMLVIPGLIWIALAFWIWFKLCVYIFFTKPLRKQIVAFVMLITVILTAIYSPVRSTFQTTIPYELAQKERDPDHCMDLKDENMQKQCVYDIYDITDGSQLPDCRLGRYLSDIEHAKCIINSAKINNDIKICDQIRAWSVIVSGASEECYKDFIGTAQWEQACAEGYYLEGAKCPQSINADSLPDL